MNENVISPAILKVENDKKKVLVTLKGSSLIKISKRKKMAHLLMPM